MSDNDAMVWMVVTSIVSITIARFLKFLTDMARLDDATTDKSKESAWDDEL